MVTIARCHAVFEGSERSKFVRNLTNRFSGVYASLLLTRWGAHSPRARLRHSRGFLWRDTRPAPPASRFAGRGRTLLRRFPGRVAAGRGSLHPLWERAGIRKHRHAPAERVGEVRGDRSWRRDNDERLESR